MVTCRICPGDAGGAEVSRGGMEECRVLPGKDSAGVLGVSPSRSVPAALNTSGWVGWERIRPDWGARQAARVGMGGFETRPYGLAALAQACGEGTDVRRKARVVALVVGGRNPDSTGKTPRTLTCRDQHV